MGIGHPSCAVVADIVEPAGFAAFAGTGTGAHQVSALVVAGDHQQGLIPVAVLLNPFNYGIHSSVEVVPLCCSLNRRTGERANKEQPNSLTAKQPHDNPHGLSHWWQILHSTGHPPAVGLPANDFDLWGVSIIEGGKQMRTLLPAVSLCLGLTGCYTMILPPPSESSYGDTSGGQVVTIPDSLSGKGVIIVNQNQVILDRYYQDLFYQRSGLFGGSGCWDPYYYNPRGYYYDHRWHRGGHYPPGPSSPQPKKSRRDEDYRSESPPVNSPGPEGASAGMARAPASYAILADAPLPVQTPSVSKDTVKEEVAPSGDNGRAPRSVQPSNPAEQTDPSDDQQNGNKSRRGIVRER